MHPQLRKTYVPLGCPSLVVYWPSSISWQSSWCRAFVFTDARYSCGPSSRSSSEWLGETNSSTSSISRIGSKKLCSADQNANPAFALFYLGVLPPLCQNCHENCTNSHEFWRSDTSPHHESFLGPHVDATGIPTNELWCVKSILLATSLLGS